MPYGLIMEFLCVLKVPKNINNEYFQDSKTRVSTLPNFQIPMTQN